MTYGQEQALWAFFKSLFNDDGDIKDLSSEEVFEYLKPVFHSFHINAKLKRIYCRRDKLRNSVYESIHILLKAGNNVTLNRIKALSGGRKDNIRNILSEDGWYNHEDRKILITLSDLEVL